MEMNNKILAKVKQAPDRICADGGGFDITVS